jgi:formylglycine-generating enzyme required for sulfatase activity
MAFIDFYDGALGIYMAFVKGGTFAMGATAEQGSDSFDNEKPVHSVTLSDFYICKHEVTQKQWFQVMGTTIEQQKDKQQTDNVNLKCLLAGTGDDYPMYYVSWDEAQEFIRKLNQKTGKNYRLPTEAEWEYTARGGSESKGYKYSGSNNIDDVAWYNAEDVAWWHCEYSGFKTHPVGQKLPNELGIYDMNGNVAEWVNDYYDKYGSDSQTNPVGPNMGSNRVIRGGAWFVDAKYCRVSERGSRNPGDRDSSLGFRLALSLNQASL